MALCATLRASAATTPDGFFDGVAGLDCAIGSGDPLPVDGIWTEAGCYADSYTWLDGRTEIFNDNVLVYTSDPATCQNYAKMYGYTTAAMSAYYYNFRCYACTNCVYNSYGTSDSCSNGIGGDTSFQVYSYVPALQTLEGCASLCLLNGACGGFLYGGKGLGNGTADSCTLRRFADTSAKASLSTPGCGSADPAPAGAPQAVWYTRRDLSFFSVQEHTDYPQNDFWYDASKTPGDLDDCAAACMREPYCVAFVLNSGTDYYDGCWYKSYIYWGQYVDPSCCTKTAYVRQLDSYNYPARPTTSPCSPYYSSLGCCAASNFDGGIAGSIVSADASLNFSHYWSGWYCSWNFLNPSGAFISTSYGDPTTCVLGDYDTAYTNGAGSCQAAYTTDSLISVNFRSSYGNAPPNNAGFTLSFVYSPDASTRPAISFFSVSQSLTCSGNSQTPVSGVINAMDCAEKCMAVSTCGGFMYSAGTFTCTLVDFVYRRGSPSYYTPGCMWTDGASFYTRSEMSFFLQADDQTMCGSWDTALARIDSTSAAQCASACLSEPTCQGFVTDGATCTFTTQSVLSNSNACFKFQSPPTSASQYQSAPPPPSQSGSATSASFTFYSRALSSSTSYSPCIASSSAGCCAASSYSPTLPSDGRVSEMTIPSALTLLAFKAGWTCTWTFSNPWLSTVFSSFSIIDSSFWYGSWTVDAGAGPGADFSSTSDLSVTFSSPMYSGSYAFSLGVTSFTSEGGSSSGGAAGSPTDWFPTIVMSPNDVPNIAVHICDRDTVGSPAGADASWTFFPAQTVFNDTGALDSLDMLLRSPGDTMPFFNGGGAVFTNASYASLVNRTGASFTIGGTISIAFWAFMGSDTVNTNAPFFALFNASTTAGRTTVTEQLLFTAKGELSYSSATGAKQTLALATASDSSKWYSGKWYHLAVVLEPTAATFGASSASNSSVPVQGIATLYVDGNPINIGPMLLPLTIARNTFNLARPATPSSKTPVFQGGFADVNVFARALSPPEVFYLASGCTGAEPDPRDSGALTLATITGTSIGSYAQGLVGLDLSNFGLSGSIPSSISNLILLTSLNLDNNRALGGQIPDLSFLPSLYFASLQNCNFSAFASDYGAHVQILLLANNSVSGALPVTPWLLNVDASDNQLTSLNLTDGATCNLANLVLDNNNIANAPAFIASKCLNLTYLSISDNNIRDVNQSASALATFNNLLAPNLTTLSVARNTLTGAALRNIGTLASLTSLDLSGNDFVAGTSLPTTLFSGILTSLDLHATGLSGTIPSAAGTDADGNPVYFGSLNLASNSLVGSIPSSLGVSVDAGSLVFLNDNRLSGTCVYRRKHLLPVSDCARPAGSLWSLSPAQ